MVPLTALWLPILVSAVLTFVVSAVIWMAMPHHKNDFARVSDEEGVMDALRGNVSGPGLYYFPWGMGADLKSDAYREKVSRGPVGILRVKSAESTLSMGPAMVKSFLLYLVIGLFVAYVASRTIAPGAEYMRVFQVTSTVAFMAHGFGTWQEHIWFGLPGSVAFKNTVDALVYSLFVAGAFGWLWPG